MPEPTLSDVMSAVVVMQDAFKRRHDGVADMSGVLAMQAHTIREMNGIHRQIRNLQDEVRQLRGER